MAMKRWLQSEPEFWGMGPFLGDTKVKCWEHFKGRFDEMCEIEKAKIEPPKYFDLEEFESKMRFKFINGLREAG